MLQKQKLEYTDFSAGISENTVPGKANAYARADNLLITRDKHLETRPGSSALSDTLYVLPSFYQRVGSLFNFYNDTALLAHSGKDFFYATGSPLSWATVLGPTGGHAFAHNSTTNRVFSAPWRQHLYLVPHGGDSPQVFYYDNSGAAQLRTAGLPRPTLAAALTDVQLLTSGITLATSLVSFMLLHMRDAGGAGHAHLNTDVAGAAALVALTTPFTLTDLITYVGVIKTYYNLHIADALLTGVSQNYHAQVSGISAGSGGSARYSVLNTAADTTLPLATDLLTTLAVLNDLTVRYNFHTWSTITHVNAVAALSTGATYTTDSTGYGKYACTTPTITLNQSTVAGTTIYSPVFSGGISVILAYLNRIKKEYNEHLSDTHNSGFTESHNNADADNVLVVPDATDLFSAYVMLAHFEFFYWWHYKDSKLTEAGANIVFQTFTGTATIGSASMTSTSINGSNFVGYFVVNIAAANPWVSWAQDALFQPNTVVSSGTASTVVFNHVSLDASGAGTYRISQSKYHYDLDQGGVGSATSPDGYNVRVSAFDYSLKQSNLSLFMSSLNFWFGLFKTHELSGWNLQTINGLPRYFMNSGQTSTLFAPHYSNPASPAMWPESQPGLVVADKITDALYLNTPPVVSSVLYTLVWRYNYTSGGLSFENDSTPALLSQLYWTPSPVNPLPLTTAVYPIVLSNLPILVNQVGQNWDTANIKLDIYRTISNGTTLYLVGTVNNGTTTFTDSVVDANLITNAPLYTTGGVLQNDQPPVSKFLTILNDTGYYGYVKDITSGETFPNRILQSIPSAIYAVPAENFDDLEDELTGLSNFNNYVISFCRTKIYRMEGSYDELGNGLLTHNMISPTIGAVNQAGIVQTEYGIFFCGTNGIYWTDGFTLTRVTSELENTYNALISSALQRARINGVYDKATRRIYWTFCSTPTTPECDIGYILDLNWGISERMSFTTLSGGATFLPTAWVVYNSDLIRGTSYGFIFRHNAIYTSDQTPLLEQASTPSTQWAPQTILYDFQSCATDFGSSEGTKWVTRVTYQGKAKSNLYMQINRRNNNGGAWRPLTPVRAINTLRWGDPSIKWNDTVCQWGCDGMIDTFRRMPAGSLRCDWLAVQMTNSVGVICGSDTYGVVTVSARSVGAVTLTLPTPYKWPLWATLYKIAFQNDGYVATYTISARTDQTLTVLDPNSTGPASTTGTLWQISGTPYGQVFNLTAFNVTYAPLADEQSAYHGKTSTDGGANSS